MVTSTNNINLDIRSLAEQNEQPIVNYLIDQVRGPFKNKAALFAVCPNSETVTRAALEASKEADAPLLFAATLNQVDTDGGYTGWTPRALVDFISEYSEKIGLESPVMPCLDHGGPWLKDSHTRDNLSFDETMAAVKVSLEACIDAGYDLLHIDPTVDRTIPGDDPVPIDLVADRTQDLIIHSENYRSSRGYPRIAYEVGTEEVHGGLANKDSFNKFLSLLDTGLKKANMEYAWPCFVVGKVGTDLHTTYFEPSMARDLTSQTEVYGAAIKGHYSDYVDNPEDYPLSGMGGANVGPEFTEEEFLALMDLMKLEKKIGKQSGLYEALEHAVLTSNRWQKWLQKDETGADFQDLTQSRREWLMRTCSRYIWTHPDVLDTRKKLYNNLSGYRDADSYVKWSIKKSMHKYFHCFNLIHFNQRLTQQEIPA
ncbi:class II D-tagatose-bisphosphate aldolase, non-catalytic subunit [Balneolales bacterium ANBcel1]|nr:class II D-tagatose-bisphosphate aldolase, non-catalytic subunit [Balneolales bacterium ANBcel1]